MIRQYIFKFSKWNMNSLYFLYQKNTKQFDEIIKTFQTYFYISIQFSFQFSIYIFLKWPFSSNATGVFFCFLQFNIFVVFEKG